MADRPILFSGPMVCALLEGRKTQTRRTVKPQPELSARMGFVQADRRGNRWAFGVGADDRQTGRNFVHRCPYGKPCDLLWVRETWARDNDDGTLMYKASRDDENNSDWQWLCDHGMARWKPSIHMPRAASRLTLRISDVRVERLQTISEADAEAEGCGRSDCYPHTFRDAYASLWDRINGPGAWGANPWVWALTFEVIKANVDTVKVSP